MIDRSQWSDTTALRPPKFNLVAGKRQTTASRHFRLPMSLTASIFVGLAFEVIVIKRVVVDPTSAAGSTFTLAVMLKRLPTGTLPVT